MLTPARSATPGIAELYSATNFFPALKGRYSLTRILQNGFNMKLAAGLVHPQFHSFPIVAGLDVIPFPAILLDDAEDFPHRQLAQGKVSLISDLLGKSLRLHLSALVE
jgi:hypothetical protein